MLVVVLLSLVLISHRLVRRDYRVLLLLEWVVVHLAMSLGIYLVRILTTGWRWWSEWELLVPSEDMRLRRSIVLVYVDAVYLELLH